MPDTPQYLERIRTLSQNSDFLVAQRETLAVLADLIRGASESQLSRRPAPGKWSVGEILAHLAEDEVTSYWRYRQMIENNGVALNSFDQDLWSRLGDYQLRKPAESLQLFRLLREANLGMLALLSSEEWQRFGVHAERGKITVEDLARHMAGHDVNHIEQIRKILGS
jgi:hypothetical protein